MSLSPSRSRFPAASALALAAFVLAGGLDAQSPTAADAIGALKGHTDTVEAVALSPDGQFLATACFDHKVRLFDAATGREVRTYGGPQGHAGQVLSVAFSHRGDQLVSAGADNFARLWDVPVGAPIKTWPVASSRVVVTPDGKTFGLAGADGVVRVYPQGEDKGMLELKGHAGAVAHLAMAGNTWVSAGADRTIRAWTADGKAAGSYSLAGTEITGLAVGGSAFTTSTDGYLRAWQLPIPSARSFPALKEGVTAFYASPDGNTLLIATADKTITLGVTANNAAASTFSGAKGAIEATALSPDGAVVAAGSADGTLTLWDRQGKVKGEVTAHSGGVSALQFHPSQPILITTGNDGLVKGWSLPFDPKLPKEKAVKFQIKENAGKVSGLALHPGNGQIITAGADKLIRFWDPAKPEKPIREIGPLPAAAASLTLSRDGLLLAAALGKEVRLWTTADGKEAGKLTQATDVLSVSMSADKSRLLLGRADNIAVLADVATGATVQTYPHAGAVRGVLIHPGAAQVVTASADKTVTISPIGVQRLTPLGGKVSGLVISPGLDRLVTVGPGAECASWLAGNGQKDKAFTTGGDAVAAAFSKDGQRTAVSGTDGSVRLYTVADGKLVGSIAAGASASELAFHPVLPQLAGLVKSRAVVWSIAYQPAQPLPPEFGSVIQEFPHPRGVASPVFAADGQLYTAGEDKLVRRFRIASETPVKTFGHPNLVACAAFDPTGNLVATGCHDGILRIWDVAKGNVAKTVNAHVVATQPMVQNPIYAVVWTADGKQIFTSSYDRSIKLWDAAGGTLVREFKPAPDAPTVEIKDDKKDKKDPPKKEPAGPVGHRDAVFSIALSKDGKYLASGSSDKTVKLWDVATGKVIRDFPNPDLKPSFPGEPSPSHPGWIHVVRFTPDGQYLVSAGAAPRFKAYVAVWKVADGQKVTGGERDMGAIHALELSADGARMFVGGAAPRGRSEPDALILKLPGK